MTQSTPTHYCNAPAHQSLPEYIHDDITDDQIKALSAEAAKAGDLEMVEICDDALDGNRDAIAECAYVIADAAMEENA